MHAYIYYRIEHASRYFVGLTVPVKTLPLILLMLITSASAASLLLFAVCCRRYRVDVVYIHVYFLLIRNLLAFRPSICVQIQIPICVHTHTHKKEKKPQSRCPLGREMYVQHKAHICIQRRMHLIQNFSTNTPHLRAPTSKIFPCRPG